MGVRVRGIGGRTLDGTEKRTLLLDAAERTFCRLGFTHTTIAAIAADADVTRPTVYAYFASRDDVFRALAERVRDDFLALQEDIDAGSARETGRAGVVGYLHAYIRHRGILTVLRHQALADPAMRALQDEIHGRPTRRHTRFLAAHDPAALAVPPPVLAELVTGMVMRLADLAAADPDRLPALTRDLLAAYERLAGLAPESPGSLQADS